MPRLNQTEFQPSRSYWWIEKRLIAALRRQPWWAAWIHEQIARSADYSPPLVFKSLDHPDTGDRRFRLLEKPPRSRYRVSAVKRRGRRSREIGLPPTVTYQWSVRLEDGAEFRGVRAVAVSGAVDLILN